MAIEKGRLEALYIHQEKSVTEVARALGVSSNTIIWWMKKHGIQRRSRSQAAYAKRGEGKPFAIKDAISTQEATLLGMGLGLYWGEGNKRNRHSVRLGNTDPKLLQTWVTFLTTLCGVRKDDLRFSLQIFSDMNAEEALTYWHEALSAKPSQFYKTTVTISGSIGTYRHKSQYGVLTVYFNSKRLRDTLMDMLP